MPVFNPSFQSENRLDGSSDNDNTYESNSPIRLVHAGLFAFIVAAAAIHAFIIRRRKGNSIDTLSVYPAHCSPRGTRLLRWGDEKEMSRGVSEEQQPQPRGGKFVFSLPTTNSSRNIMSAPSGSGGEKTEGFEKEASTPASPATTASTIVETHEASSQSHGPEPAKFSRPSPPPPLTLPELADTLLPRFQSHHDGRRRSFPPPLPTAAAAEFIHQPNPDYVGESSSISPATVTTAPPTAISGTDTETAIPRRRSYTRTVGLGSSFPPAMTTLPVDFTERSGVENDEEATARHSGHGEEREDVVAVQGEIISSLDGAGHGWLRHTRVYGGGPCLACLRSGEGFYGPNVPLDQRRH